MKNLGRRSKKTSVADAKQDYDKSILDLESENEALKQEIERLKAEKLAKVSSSPDITIRKLEEDYPSRSDADQGKPMSGKNSTQKHRNVEAADSNVVLKLKAQKVKLQCKIKLDSVQFRLQKASLEKEILQLKKDQRKKELETRILLASTKRQKLMLQRKKTEVLSTLKQLKQLLESGKTSSNKARAAGTAKGFDTKFQDAKHLVEVTMRLHAVQSDYERQIDEIAEEIRCFRLGADTLKADMLNGDRLKADMLSEENSCSLSQVGQVDDTLVNSELKELKDEFAKLSVLFSQMEMSKSHLSECDRSQGTGFGNQVNSAQSSSSNASQVGSSYLEALPSQNSQPSPLEHSQEIVFTMKNTESKVCCSCSKKSSCKTSKCECRSARGSCGASCGCTASKCANREARVEPVKPINSENVEKQVAYSDSAGNQPQKTTETSDDSGPKKQPLHDIGNLLAKPVAGAWKSCSPEETIKDGCCSCKSLIGMVSRL